MVRLYREQPDSRALPAPRVLARVLPELGTLVAAVRFYEALTGVALDQDMDIPESGLHVVAVGGFLILEIDPAKLGRAEQATASRVTVVVPDLGPAVEARVRAGAQVVQQQWTAPPGPGMRLRHPDGLLVEYVEHRRSEYDADEPGTALRWALPSAAGLSCPEQRIAVDAPPVAFRTGTNCHPENSAETSRS